MNSYAPCPKVVYSTPILNEDGDPIWKVLVFDKMGRDVISSVLRVNDVQMNSYAPCPKVVYPQYTADNISAHFIKHQDLPLHSQRYPIPDVPVVYFVEPTPDNIQAITRDLSHGVGSTKYTTGTSGIGYL
jgi:hypothetical protein